MQTLTSHSKRLSWIIALFFTASSCFWLGCGGDDQAQSKNADSTKSTNMTGPNTDVSAPLSNGSGEKSAADQVEKTHLVEEPKIEEPEIEEPMVNNSDFHETLNEASNNYLTFGMVTPQVAVAPEDCAAPSEEPRPTYSESEHESSHGKKLYFLFAKEIGHYLTQDGTTNPVGQTLVKESWASKEANPNARNMRNHASANRINPRAMVGDKSLQITERKALFVMKKLAVDTPETDQGWVYGVIDPETKEVIAAGKIASCMKCHEDAKNDRLFGPADAK